MYILMTIIIISSIAVPSETMSEQSVTTSGRVRYGSTSSLSSAATGSSPCAAGIPVCLNGNLFINMKNCYANCPKINFSKQSQSAMSTSISPIITAPSNTTSQMLITSPPRGHSSSPPTTTSTNGNNQPITLISSANNHLTITEQQASQPHQHPQITSSAGGTLKVVSTLPNGITTKTNGLKNNGHTNSNHIAINFTTADGISPALLTATSTAMPITLNGKLYI